MITLLNKFDDNYIIHEDDVYEIALYYIKTNNLELFLNDINFNNESNDLATYTPNDNNIVLNNERIWKTCYKWADKLKEKYHIDDRYYSYILNFYYMYVLFHEMTHANQKKNHDMLTTKTPGVYLFLYELCEKLHHDSQAFYDKNHDLFPMEIEANNNGLLKAYSLISHTKLPKKEAKVFYLQYLQSLLSNYKKINKYRILTPFDKLYEEENRINRDLMYKLFDDANLSKIDRLNLGLDITPNEYNNLQKEKLRILIKR